MRQAFYVLSTHWDREWYQPMMEYRFRLVNLLDGVLDGFRDGSLNGPLQTDGQTILLEDYLEVRRDREGEIRDRLADGSLKAGPWYVMPDEFLVSGESLIRNLRHGRETVRRLGGEPSAAGFVCDIFGHCSQLPQIFAGFGIPMALLWRGVNDPDHRFFLWEGADGTRLPTYKFGWNGYCTYAAAVRRADRHDVHPTREELEKNLRDHLKTETAAAGAGPVLLFDGGDHMGWDRNAYAVIRAGLTKSPAAGLQLVHGPLDDFMAAAAPYARKAGLPLRGELREPASIFAPRDLQWLIPGVLSSRVPLKQANAACQDLLCLWAEPFTALAVAACGAPADADYFRIAWQWLLQNHPHDSICGCSIDRVHEDMLYRFSQCRTTGERLTRNAFRLLAVSDVGELKPDEVAVTVFNPLPRPLAEVVDVTVELPADWPVFKEFFGFETLPSFRVFTRDGRELPYQRLSQTPPRPRFREHAAKFPEGYQVCEVRISLELELPALGGTSLIIRRDPDARPTRYPANTGLATSERSMANEFLEVFIADNGTLTIGDLRTGAVYERALTFEDSADIGDGWYHGRALADQTFVSSACRSEIALVADGACRTTFRIRTRMDVPAEFDFTAMRRTEARAALVIDSLVTLRKGADRVEIETTVENPAKDHRLRVLFPTGAATASTYLADAPFDVVERPVALRTDNYLYRELEVETKPQQTWTAVFQDGRGLAVVASGLLETAVRDLPERPLALTLFRGTRRTVFTAGEPGGQLNGPLTFRYWLAPLAGAPDRRRLCELGQQLGAGVRSFPLQSKDVAPSSSGRKNAASGLAGLLQLEGPAVLTSARTVGDGFEVRLFNPTEAAADVCLRPGPALARTYRYWRPVDMESRPSGRRAALASGKGLRLTLNPKQILTLRLEA